MHTVNLGYKVGDICPQPSKGSHGVMWAVSLHFLCVYDSADMLMSCTEKRDMSPLPEQLSGANPASRRPCHRGAPVGIEDTASHTEGRKLPQNPGTGVLATW